MIEVNKKIIIFSFVTILLILLIFNIGYIRDKNFKNKVKEDGDLMKEIIMLVNGHELNVVLENNSCTNKLLEKLKIRDLNINLNDYGNFEKVGELGFSLPRSDSYINTSPGDIMLYLGDKITIFYDYNSYTYTRIGKIKDVNQSDLKNILGSGQINVTFKLKDD